MNDNELTFAGSSKKQKLECLIKILGFGLPVLSAAIACALTFLPRWSFTIEKPLFLLASSLIVIIPFRTENIITLQKIITFYLFSIIVNQIAAQYFSLSIFSFNINVSYSAIILFLCAIGFILGKVSSTASAISQADKSPSIISGWILALAIIIIHMIFLGLILKIAYGFGYEHDISVLGNLCLYFLLFLTLWQKLNELRFRQLLGLILTFFFVILIVRNLI